MKMGSKDPFVFTLRGGLKMPALGLGTYAPKEVVFDVVLHLIMLFVYCNHVREY